MQPRTKWIAGAVVAIAVIGGGTGIGLAASSGDDDDQPLTGSTRDRGRSGGPATHPVSNRQAPELGAG